MEFCSVILKMLFFEKCSGETKQLFLHDVAIYSSQSSSPKKIILKCSSGISKKPSTCCHGTNILLWLYCTVPRTKQEAH